MAVCCTLLCCTTVCPAAVCPAVVWCWNLFGCVPVNWSAQNAQALTKGSWGRVRTVCAQRAQRAHNREKLGALLHWHILAYIDDTTPPQCWTRGRRPVRLLDPNRVRKLLGVWRGGRGGRGGRWVGRSAAGAPQGGSVGNPT